MTVAVLRLCLKRGTSGFKLVIMSATLNMSDWEDFFGGSGVSFAVYKQAEAEHPIHDFFLADACALVGLAPRRVVHTANGRRAGR